MTTFAPSDPQITSELGRDPTLRRAAPTYPHPGKRFVLQHPAFFIALGGGAGLSPVAPGTVGTLVAFPLFWLINQNLDPVQFLLLINVMFIAGIWACSLTGKVLGIHDHSGIVW
ncbi:MAG: phosphatidylglycerophosphatase A, partial [Nitrosomonadaceae bacterium]